MSERVELEAGGGGPMRKSILIGGALVVLANAPGMLSGALAGPWEDGMAAYNRGDYAPAIPLFRPLAEAGNAKAQTVLGVMYHRGQGVARNSVRAFVWFSRASARGDANEKIKAKVGLGQVPQTLTPEKLRTDTRQARA